MSTKKFLLPIQKELIRAYREAMAEYFEEVGCIETAEEIMDYNDAEMIIHALTDATNHWLKETEEIKKEVNQG